MLIVSTDSHPIKEEDRNSGKTPLYYTSDLSIVSLIVSFRHCRIWWLQWRLGWWQWRSSHGRLVILLLPLTWYHIHLVYSTGCAARIERLHGVIKSLQQDNDRQDKTMEQMEKRRQDDSMYYLRRIREISDNNSDLHVQRLDQLMTIDHITSQNNSLETALATMTQQSEQQQQEIYQLKAELRRMSSSNKKLKTQSEELSKSILGVKRALRPKKNWFLFVFDQWYTVWTSK